MYLPGRKQKSKPLGRYRKHLKCNFEAKHGSTHLPSGGLGRCTSLDSGRARMHPRAGSVVVLSKLQKPSLSCTLPPFQLWTPLPHSSDRSIICKAFLSFLPPPSLPALSQSSDFFEASSEELWMLAQYCRGMECLQCRVSLVVWSYDSGFLITAFDCLYTQLPPPPPFNGKECSSRKNNSRACWPGLWMLQCLLWHWWLRSMHTSDSSSGHHVYHSLEFSSNVLF